MKLRHIALTALFVTTLAACGGGGDDNSASSTPPPTDARSGTYQLYAANGQKYQITVDFINKTYTLSGTGTNITGTLTSDDSTNTSYTFQQSTGTGTTNNAHVRYSSDLLIGGLNVGSNLVPFVAARKFVSDPTALSGNFSIFSRNTSSTGTAQSAFYSATISNSSVTACANTTPVLASVCPADATIKSPIVANGNALSASLAGGPVTFQVAQSGLDTIILGAEPTSDGGTNFSIGLPTSLSTLQGTFTGQSTANETVVVALAGSIVSRTFESTTTPSNGVPIKSGGAIIFPDGYPAGLGATFVSVDGKNAQLLTAASNNVGIFSGVPDSSLSGYLFIGGH